MVVSEIGDVLFPKTAPQRQEAIDGTKYFRLSPEQILTAIGIRREKVPQAVPVEKERAIPTKNTTAGIICGGIGES